MEKSQPTQPSCPATQCCKTKKSDACSAPKTEESSDLTKLQCKRECKGDCCKLFYFPLFNRDHAMWASYHDVRVFKTESGDYKGMLPVACEHLTEDGKCGVYGTDKRPKMCETYWCDIAEPMEEVFFTPKISVITPSIRPNGLKVVFDALQQQTFKGFEWLPRLSVPGKTSDLCYQMNKAVEEAQGEIIVFLQDYISIGPEVLGEIYRLYKTTSDAFTFPMVKDWEEDWRCFREDGSVVKPEEWEIDFGACLKKDIVKAGMFDEKYDDGFGWENVDLAYRMGKEGVVFRVKPTIRSYGQDHEVIEPHPYRHKPNQSYWEVRKGVIDLMYAED